MIAARRELLSCTPNKDGMHPHSHIRHDPNIIDTHASTRAPMTYSPGELLKGSFSTVTLASGFRVIVMG